MEGHCKRVVELSIPVRTYDAQRTEALGPPMGLLITATLPAADVRIEGDSSYIIGLLGA